MLGAVSWKKRTLRLSCPACKLVLWKILWRFQLTIQTQTPKGNGVTLMSNLPMAKKWIKTMLYLSIQQNIIYPQKEWNLVSYSNMNGTGGYYIKGSKSGSEKRMSRVLKFICWPHGGGRWSHGYESLGMMWARECRERMVNTSRELSGMRNGFRCSRAHQSNYCWLLSISRQQ